MISLGEAPCLSLGYPFPKLSVYFVCVNEALINAELGGDGIPCV